MADYTPVATPLGAFAPVPADGDPPTGAILGGPHEVTFDAIRDLQLKVNPGSVGTFPVTQAAIARLVGVPLCPVGGNATIVEFADVNPNGACPVVSVTGNYFFRVLFDPPEGAVLFSVRAYVYKPGASQSLRLYSLDHQVPFNSGAGGFGEYLLATELAIATTTTAIGMAGTMYYMTATVPGGVTVADRNAKSYFARVSGAAGTDTKWFDRIRATYIPATADLGAG